MGRERLLVPPHIVDLVKAKCSDKMHSDAFDKLEESIKTFIKEDLKNIDKAIYAYYETPGSRLTADTLKRAFGEKHPNYVSRGSNIYLLDLLCYYARGTNYETMIEYLTSRKEIVKEEDVVNISSTKIKLINSAFLKSLKITEEERLKVLTKFYTHLDSRLTWKAVCNEDIIIPFNEVFDVADADKVEIPLKLIT